MHFCFLTVAGDPPLLNVARGMDLSIPDHSLVWANAMGDYRTVGWDTRIFDGTSINQLDVSRLVNLGFCARIALADGLT